MIVRAGIHLKLHRDFIYQLGCLISIEQLRLIAVIPGLYTLVGKSNALSHRVQSGYACARSYLCE